MTTDDTDSRRAKWREASRKARAERKAAGLPAHRGKSGGKATEAERQRRRRERIKQRNLED